jgi:hypothetical protein
MVFPVLQHLAAVVLVVVAVEAVLVQLARSTKVMLEAIRLEMTRAVAVAEKYLLVQVKMVVTVALF